MTLFIISALYGAFGAYLGIKATERVYPINPPDRIESGCIILATMVMWPVLLLILMMGFLFDKTTNY